MLDREVVTLGCSEQGLYINIHTHTHKPGFHRLCGTSEADGQMAGVYSTAALLTALYLLHIMSATAHTASWLCPAYAGTSVKKQTQPNT